MQKNTLFSTLCLASGLLLAPLIYAERTTDNAVTEPEKLREITDNYINDPRRPNDFVSQGDGTVVDKRTGLQWMQCSLGQTWTGETCEGELEGYDWQQAMNLKETFAGHSDWRLPTRFELETLIYCSVGKNTGRDNSDSELPHWLNGCDGNADEPYQQPTIAQKAFPNTGGYFPHYWSSTSDVGKYSDNAWGVYFGSGEADFYKKRSSKYVRLVRGRQ